MELHHRRTSATTSQQPLKFKGSFSLCSFLKSSIKEENAFIVCWMLIEVLSFFMYRPLTSHHSHIKEVLSVGGNLHDIYISTVAIFDALEEKEQRLCHVGDYVVYRNKLEQVITITYTVH